MAVHVYLQQQNKSTKQALPSFRYRGETGPNDDPQSFKRVMARKGLKVELTDTFQGVVVETDKANQLGWL